MSIQLEYTSVSNWPAVTLANDAIRAVVIPELGGKIVSLQSRRSDREWLWKNPHVPLRTPPLGATDFGLFDAGGWDEVFPTVNPCRVPESAWGDRTLTDHGELWYRPWRTVAAHVIPYAAASLTLAVDNLELPFRFERTLTLSDGTGPLIASYELANRSDQPLPYLWAAHPLLAIEPGDSICLPKGTRMSSTGSVGLKLVTGADSFAWPTARLTSGEMLDVSRTPERGAGYAIKLFAENVSPRYIEIVGKGHDDFIRISFEPAIVSHVGLWLNYGGWSGAGTEPYYNAGIEPTTSPHDDLSAAILDKAASHLQLGESHRWQLMVTAGQHLSQDQSA